MFLNPFNIKEKNNKNQLFNFMKRFILKRYYKSNLIDKNSGKLSIMFN